MYRRMSPNRVIHIIVMRPSSHSAKRPAISFAVPRHAPLSLILAAIATLASSHGSVAQTSCPKGAITIEPGAMIQTAVDRAGDGATFCLKNGTYRMQAIRPRPRQSFYGEGQTILNGSVLLTDFKREGRYWVATWRQLRVRRPGSCEKATPTCNMPEHLFFDDHPLLPVTKRDDVEAGRYYFDRPQEKIYVVDDPTNRKIEMALMAYAFESAAPNVSITNIIIEKYATSPQKGAIQAEQAMSWTIQNCEVRLNSAAGITVGVGAQVRNCKIHDNGQIGVTGSGRDILIEDNQIWTNNTRGYDPGWEAGGVKLSYGDGSVIRRNRVYDNRGPGLWCDGDCRNTDYDSNVVERNYGAGIYHEISYNAVIRNNVVRHNGITEREWVWGSDIIIAASQDVDVYGNTITVSPEKCAVMLVDQGRDDRPHRRQGPLYKTQNNKVHDNDFTFEGAACAGGASDVEPDHESYRIIADGNNVFDRNLYRVPKANARVHFEWGHVTLDWNELRAKGLETNGRLLFY